MFCNFVFSLRFLFLSFLILFFIIFKLDLVFFVEKKYIGLKKKKFGIEYFENYINFYII